jgi:hypothetical protein
MGGTVDGSCRLQAAVEGGVMLCKRAEQLVHMRNNGTTYNCLGNDERLGLLTG